MEKAELYRLLSSADKKSPHWDIAFAMYKAVFPKSEEHKDCRSCRGKILKWLRRG